MTGRPASRRKAFAAILAAMLVAAAAFVAWAALRDDPGGEGSGPLRVSSVRGEPHVVFQNGGPSDDPDYGQVALARLDERGERVTAGLTCDRVYFAAGRGLCLDTVGPRKVSDIVIGRSGHRATITGPDLRPRRRFSLEGIPSRARISPDGRYGATTVFVTGHSYAGNDFSTQTLLIDMASGRKLADIERDFRVTRDGERIKEIDFNFWGVTFARRPDRFYATLGTAGKTYLLEGDVRSRRARVLHENVECPSISPDNTRIAYKKRVGKGWRLHVLDLETLDETPLAETRSVDDQVEWLDDGRVLYGLSHDTWVVPADGSGDPSKFLSRALSPAVVSG